MTRPDHIDSPAGRRWSRVGANIWHGPDLYKVQFIDTGVFQLYRSGITQGQRIFEHLGGHDTLDQALAAVDERLAKAKARETELSPTHRVRCVCGRPKGYGFAFCVGCTMLLRDRGVRIRNLEEAYSAKYDQAVEVLRQHGRVAA